MAPIRINKQMMVTINLDRGILIPPSFEPSAVGHQPTACQNFHLHLCRRRDRLKSDMPVKKFWRSWKDWAGQWAVINWRASIINSGSIRACEKGNNGHSPVK